MLAFFKASEDVEFCKNSSHTKISSLGLRFMVKSGLLFSKIPNLQIYKVNSRFKKDLNLQIHLHKAFFSDNRFLDSVHKSFLNQTTLDSRKKKRSFLNREFTVP
jgi:hypothetical protein